MAVVEGAGRTPLRRGVVRVLRLLPVLVVVGGPVLCGSAPAAAGAGPAAARDGWVAPLAPPLAVVGAFRPPRSAWGAGHRGVDLAAPPGAVVRAAGAGTVAYAGRLAGRGVVTVVHGPLRTTYEPVVASVRVGAQVAAGAALGGLAAGHPGCPVAACLHWGLLRGDDYLDPLALLRAAELRLLPLGAAPSPRARPAVRARGDEDPPGSPDRWLAAAGPGDAEPDLVLAASALAAGGAGGLLVLAASAVALRGGRRWRVPGGGPQLGPGPGGPPRPSGGAPAAGPWPGAARPDEDLWWQDEPPPVRGAGGPAPVVVDLQTWVRRRRAG